MSMNNAGYVEAFVRRCVADEVFQGGDVHHVSSAAAQLSPALTEFLSRIPGEGLTYFTRGNNLDFLGDSTIDEVNEQFATFFDRKAAQRRPNPSWKKNWLVIATQHDAHPVVVDTSSPALPVFAGLQGEVDYQIAPTFESFLELLTRLAEVSNLAAPETTGRDYAASEPVQSAILDSVGGAFGESFNEFIFG